MIASIPPDSIPIAVRHGIAPAMNADIRSPHWGPTRNGDGDLIADKLEDLNWKQQLFCGFRDEYRTHYEMRKVLEVLDSNLPKGTCDITAREYIQHHMNAIGCEQLLPPTARPRQRRRDLH